MFQNSNFLILQLTKDCNLRCKYCFIKDKDEYKGKIIDFQIIKDIVDRIVIDCQISGHKNFRLILHGGEPTMAGSKYIYKILDYTVTTLRYNNIEPELGIQTNGTLLTEELLMVLEKFKSNLGISFDGFNESNTLRFKGSILKKKFKLLKKYNIHFGFIMVAHKKNYKNIYRDAKKMYKRYGVSPKINPMESVDKDDDDLELNSEEIFNYIYKPFIDKFMKRGEVKEANTSEMIVKFLESITVDTVYQMKTACHGKICGGGMSMITLNPLGEMYLCDRYSKDFNDAYVKSIYTKDFLQVKQLKKFKEIVMSKHRSLLKTGCDTCFAQSICSFGCMAFHYSKYGEWGIRKDLVCPLYKNLYKYMFLNREKLLKAYINKKGNTLDVDEKIIKVHDWSRKYEFKQEKQKIIFKKRN